MNDWGRVTYNLLVHAAMMRQLPWPSRCITMLLLSSIAACCTPTGHIRADEPGTNAAERETQQLWHGNSQVEQCAWCHYSPGNEIAQRPTDFCQLTEVRQWLSADKHAIARQRIEPRSQKEFPHAAASNELSLRMVTKLGYRIETEEGYAQYRDNCLTCHAGYEMGYEMGYAPERETAKVTRDNLEQQPGISCVYCHQDGSNQLWLEQHGSPSAPQSWRALSPTIKQQRGLRALASADSQATLCVSCHIGDISRHMFVTHAMYVAGHPPLPSIEHNSLMAASQPHWRSPRELWDAMRKDPAGRAKYFQTTLGVNSSATGSNASGPDVAWNTQAALIGAVIAHEQHITLLAQAAQAKSSVRWGDYALYDCAGCHHSVQPPTRSQPSFRQQHARGTSPGRPLPPQWSAALLHTASELTNNQSVQESEQRFINELTDVPFGRPDRMGAASAELLNSLAEFRSQLNAQTFNQQQARRTLDILARTPPSMLVDYESARQVAWSASAISVDLTDDLSSASSLAMSQAIANLLLHPRDQQKQLELNLPGHQNQEIYPQSMREHQRLESRFDPKAFVLMLQQWNK